MKISLVQMNSIDDKPANLAQARRLIEQAVADERPDWIQLPEVFDFLGGTRAAKLAAAEVLPAGPGDAAGPAYALIRDLARRHGVFIHAGSMLEKIPGEERIANTTVAFDREGREVARYRKIHLFDITTPDGPSIGKAQPSGPATPSSPMTAKASESVARSVTIFAFRSCSRP